jgi:hypothetical protein
MHTEGSIIFADTKVFDKRRQRRERWRWETAKELLDPSNSEPSSSSLLGIFQPFAFGAPTRKITLNVELLHNLLFNENETIEATVTQSVNENFGLDAKRFRRFLRDRVQIVHGIASFLLAHLQFEGEGLADRAVELAKNTLAYYLGNEEQRAKLETLFRTIAEEILQGATTEEVRTILRRSPLAPTTVNRLNAWLGANRTALAEAFAGGVLLALVTAVILQYSRSDTISALSDQTVMPSVIESWVGGASFEAILNLLTERDIRIGGNNRFPTVEDAVAICESGIGYEGAMIMATIADLSEGEEGELPGGLALIQRQMKCGLSSLAELAFFEAGFSDRVVAQALAEVFPDAADRQSARNAIRNNADQARVLLADYPAYFASVMDELLT